MTKKEIEIIISESFLNKAVKEKILNLVKNNSDIERIAEVFETELREEIKRIGKLQSNAVSELNEKIKSSELEINEQKNKIEMEIEKKLKNIPIWDLKSRDIIFEKYFEDLNESQENFLYFIREKLKMVKDKNLSITIFK